MQNGFHSNETLRIHYDKDKGMRKYMEDELLVIKELEPVPTTFLGIFDGHGGKEAAIYAKDNLFNNIKMQSGFYEADCSRVKEAIRDGFLKTHNDMFNIVDTWPKRKDGHNSTSGTTATVVIIRNNKLFVAHVGDSAAAIAEKRENKYTAIRLTEDHKPESVKERTRIERMGGRVATPKHSIPRVIWKRPVKQAVSSTPRFEYVPFLAVARALGDLWSLDTNTKQFVVSPDPDIEAIDLIKNQHKFVILASDGLWGVMDENEAVDTVCKYELNQSSRRRNCSKYLIEESLSLWKKKKARADNMSAIVVFLDEEFNTWADDDDDSLSVASSEADTVILNGEEDTPPMLSDNSIISSLKRQIAFPYGDSDSTSLMSNESNTSEGEDGRNTHLNSLTTNSIKRKIEHEEIHNTSSTGQKKSRRNLTLPVPISEESHQCNVITVLSSESLYGLQLDESLFGDDDVSSSGCDDDVSNGEESNTNRSFEEHLKFVPVPQATK